MNSLFYADWKNEPAAGIYTLKFKKQLSNLRSKASPNEARQKDRPQRLGLPVSPSGGLNEG